MPLVRWLCTVACALMALPAADVAAQTAQPSPGVSLDLATARARLVSDLRYELSLAIAGDRAQPIPGTVEVRFQLADASQPLVLDFEAKRGQLRSVVANGQRTDAELVNGHIVVPAASLRTGANAVRIDFVAGEASLNRQADHLYTVFVPARARHALPCFDQPNLKGRWTITLEHPAGWQSVSNSPEAERSTANGRTRVRFAETPPLPTYLVAFVAGEFKVEQGVRDGRTMRLYHRETDAAKVARNRDAVFDLHATALREGERYTGIAYPFAKLDFAAIPAFPFGAMEHAGIIAYTDSSLLLDEAASKSEFLNRAHVIAHEVAHAWFGNLVTMAWFEDVWTKEVFANFVAAKIVTPSFPEMNHELRFFLDHYPGAYDEDRTRGAGAVRQPLANLADAGSLYTAIIYLKAPIAMRQLEELLGETNFRDGVRDYLRAHAFGNATWTDLLKALAPRAPIDLARWSAVWIDAPGRPTVISQLIEKNGRIVEFSLRQHDERGRGLVWPQRVRVSVVGSEGRRMLDVPLQAEVTRIEALTGTALPAYVLPSAGGRGYASFVVDRRSLDHLAKALATLPDPLERGSAWMTLWDAVLDGRLAPARLVDLGMRAVQSEADEQLAEQMLRDLGRAWWLLLEPAQRTARAGRWEAMLLRQVMESATTTRKSAMFWALAGTATTEKTLAWLQDVWSEKTRIPGLALAEPDQTRLALELAVRDLPGSGEMLDRQSARITHPDRSARFAFIRPAVSARFDERAKWFAALGNVEMRRHEPWVAQGLRYLNHPLRADSARQFIRPSLDLLKEIHETSNLGLPGVWLHYTLYGQNAPPAARIVEDFLDSLPPGYPDHLRDSILREADLLFRASRIIGRSGKAAARPRDATASIR